MVEGRVWPLPSSVVDLCPRQRHPQRVWCGMGVWCRPHECTPEWESLTSPSSPLFETTRFEGASSRRAIISQACLRRGTASTRTAHQPPHARVSWSAIPHFHCEGLPLRRLPPEPQRVRGARAQRVGAPAGHTSHTKWATATVAHPSANRARTPPRRVPRRSTPHHLTRTPLTCRRAPMPRMRPLEPLRLPLTTGRSSPWSKPWRRSPSLERRR